MTTGAVSSPPVSWFQPSPLKQFHIEPNDLLAFVRAGGKIDSRFRSTRSIVPVPRTTNQPEPTRVAVIADVRLYREGIARVLSERKEFAIIGTANGLDSAWALLTAATPDVVLVDMAMVDGLTVLRAIAEIQHAKVVAFGIDEVEDDVVACAEAGIVGYVPRDASLEDLVAILQSVRQGKLICSPSVASRLLHSVGRRYRRAGNVVERSVTPREHQVWNLLGRGLSNKEIATELSIEAATAKNHVHNLLGKLRVSTRAEAAAVRRPTMRAWSARSTLPTR